MMVGADRASAVYAAVSEQAGFNDLTAAEKQSVQAQLRTVFSADLAYITSRAQVNPATLQNPSGQPVATAGSPSSQTGATTAPSTLIGLGTVS